MFEQFPKIRPPLPEAYRKIYDQHYKANREGSTQASSLAQKLERWLHRKVAQDLQTLQQAPTTLEIGAGTLNQLAYEPDNNNYDIPACGKPKRLVLAPQAIVLPLSIICGA